MAVAVTAATSEPGASPRAQIGCTARRRRLRVARMGRVDRGARRRGSLYSPSPADTPHSPGPRSRAASGPMWMARGPGKPSMIENLGWHYQDMGYLLKRKNPPKGGKDEKGES